MRPLTLIVTFTSEGDGQRARLIESERDRNWPRPCETAKVLGFRVSLYPSQRAAKPIQRDLKGRLSRTFAFSLCFHTISAGYCPIRSPNRRPVRSTRSYLSTYATSVPKLGERNPFPLSEPYCRKQSAAPRFLLKHSLSPDSAYGDDGVYACRSRLRCVTPEQARTKSGIAVRLKLYIVFTTIRQQESQCLRRAAATSCPRKGTVDEVVGRRMVRSNHLYLAGAWSPIWSSA